MAKAEMKISLRSATGKGAARSSRRQGLIPAVVYGKGVQPCAAVVEPKALSAAVSTEAGLNTLITLQGDGVLNGQVVIVKDLQRHPIRQQITHIDFQIINLTDEVHVMVPVHPVGKSIGEKNGGNLQVIRHELEVFCLPSAIPDAIEVDVTNLDIGDTLHIEDLTLPAGTQVPHDVNFTVITVTGRKGDEIAEEGEGASA
jgi:large subunit ribosomal protein L25